MKARNPRQDLILRSAYQGQPTLQTKILTDAVKYTTTVTTGLIAQSYPVSEASITNFATRFATWSEFRLIRCKALIRMFSSVNPGVVKFWFEEKSSSTPTLGNANAARSLTRNCSAVDDVHSLTWTASDPLDLEWTAISGTKTPVYFKFYTNNANMGSSVVATDYFMVQLDLTYQFRGFLV